MNSAEFHIDHSFGRDTQSKWGDAFVESYNKLHDIASNFKNRSIFVVLAVSMLSLSACGGSDPKIRTANTEMQVYNQVFDESMMAGVQAKCVIQKGQSYEQTGTYTPPTGGKTWIHVVTDTCSGPSR